MICNSDNTRRQSYASGWNMSIFDCVGDRIETRTRISADISVDSVNSKSTPSWRNESVNGAEK